MSGRLTDLERYERTVTGAVLQAQVASFAELCGWSWAHFRPLLNRRGMWQVGVEGPLATGWPDLFLAHPRRRLVIGAEIKRELGDDPTPAQLRVHAILAAAGIPVYVWRPSDLRDPMENSVIGTILR